MKRLFLLLVLVILSAPQAVAELPLWEAKMDRRHVFPSNSGLELFWFDGCADCGGPWRTQASHSLGPLDENTYISEHLVDNDFETCWAVASGVDSWFEVGGGRGFERVPIHGFSIVNGYAKSPARWRQNSRIRTIELSAGERRIATVDLLDAAAVQTVNFPQDIFLKEGEKLRFTILSIYPGSYYNDLCVSEVQLSAGH